MTLTATAVVGLIVAYISRAVIGLWVALVVGLLLLVAVGLLERRRQQRKRPPSQDEIERAGDALGEQLGVALDISRRGLAHVIENMQGDAAAGRSAEQTLETWREEIEGDDSTERRLHVAALQLGTELREIRHRIEMVHTTRPTPHYGDGFRLPAYRWDEYDEVVAENPDLYRVVERAYVAAHHVNEALQMRRARAGQGRLLCVIPDDGLEAAYEAAGGALDALGEPRGEVWESSVGRTVRQVTEDLIRDQPTELEQLFAAKYGQALLSAYRDIVNQGVQLEQELVEAVQTQRPHAADVRVRAVAWCERCLLFANDPNLGLDGEQRCMFRAAQEVGRPLGDIATDVEANLTALQTIRDFLEP